MDPENTVDVNTDDLDAFNTLLNGTATEATPEPEIEAEDPVTEVDTEEDNDLATPELSEDPEDDQSKEPKRKKTAEDRIKEVVTKQRQAERALEEALAKIEQLSSPTAPVKEPVQQELPFSFPDPNALLENGDPEYPLGEFDPKYASDLAKAMFKEQMAEFKAEQKREREEAEARAARETLNESWQRKLSAVEEELPDLREKVTVLDEIASVMPLEKVQYIADTIMAMDAGPEVLYYLADNPSEAEKLKSLDYRSAALLLGRLEGVVLSSKADKADKKRVTEAPAPPKTLARGAGGKFDIPDDTDDLAAFEKKFYKK